MIDSLVDLVTDELTVTCVTGTGVDITLISTDVEGSTELWEWVSPTCLPALLLNACMHCCISMACSHHSMHRQGIQD